MGVGQGAKRQATKLRSPLEGERRTGEANGGSAFAERWPNTVGKQTVMDSQTRIHVHVIMAWNSC